MERLTIGAVANLTGVPTHTLRKWESRHSIVTPNRSESGRRFYTNEHVQRLLLVKRLMGEVWAPSFYAVGARGFTSGLINVWPEHSVAINRALEAGDFDHARRLIETMQVFEDIRAAEQGGANVSGVKCALAMLGNDCGGARPPAAWPLHDDQQASLKQFMIKNGLIS